MPLWASLGFGALVSTVILIVILNYIQARIRRGFREGGRRAAVEEAARILHEAQQKWRVP